MNDKYFISLSEKDKLDIIKFSIRVSGGMIYKMDDNFVYIILSKDSVLKDENIQNELNDLVYFGLNKKIKIVKG
ncbi:MAG: hypothetical protein RSD47_07060 [Romboutsia sp.]